MATQLAQVSVAAATAVVDYDLLRDTQFKRSSLTRRIVAVGMAGSAAAGDTKVELYVNSDLVAILFNTATGFPTRDHVFPVNIIVPSGAELSAIVKDAPSTNPINLLLLFA